MSVKTQTPNSQPLKFSGKFKTLVSRFAKAILTMIAVLPAAGLLIVVGKVIGPLGLGKIPASSAVFNQIGAVIETVGWLPFTHIGLLFAIAIGGAWSKNSAGGAFAAGLSYFTLLAVGSSFFLIKTGGTGDGEYFLNYIVGAKWTPTRGYFTWQEGVRSVSFGALGGILTGFLGAIIYNKFHTFNRLPKVLSFFNGVRFVPLMVFAIVVPLACGLALVWPLLQAGINWMGTNIAKNNRIPFAMPFLFGTLERLMLPFGLHHLLTIPMNYTELGGNLDFLDANTFQDALSRRGSSGLTGQQLADFFAHLVKQDLVKTDQLQAQGQEYMWYTWIQALNGVRDHWQSYATDQSIPVSTEVVYQVVSGSFTPARFKTGQMISSSGSLVGAAFGMLYALKKSLRPLNRSIYVSGALACLLTGVTEPVEFLFMFVSPPLYLVHALLTGVAFGMADFWPMRIHAFGLIETVLKYLMVLGPSSLITSSLSTNLWLDGVWFVFTSLIFAGVYAFTFRVLVVWLKPPIPGFQTLTPVSDSQVVTSRPPPLVLPKTQDRIATIVKLLGGKENIQEVDACMTRLRIVVSDTERVENKFKELTQALATVNQGNYYQIVYGPEANSLKEAVLKHIEQLEN